MLPRIFRCLLAAQLAGWLTLGTTRPAAAQATLLPADSLAELAHDDTAMAVQRLFAGRRRLPVARLVYAGLVGGSTAVLLATNQPETTYQRISTGLAAVLPVAAAYELARDLVRARRYRRRHEQRLLEAYDAGQPLPRWVRRRLAPGYFALRATTF